MAQRLVRRICSDCKVAETHAPQALEQLGFSADEAETVTPCKGTGCDTCNNTGYKGRVGLYEVMEVTDELRELMLVGRLGARAQAQGDRGRHDHAARQRPAEGQATA